MQEPPDQRNGSIDWERLLGGRIFQLAGFACIVGGVAYFLDLAITNGLLGPPGRVWLAAVAGVAFVAGGVVLRSRSRDMGAVADGLTATGGALLYLSAWAAGPYFDFTPLWFTTVAMSVTTALLAGLAASAKSQTLLVAALIGGFCTPGLVHGADAYSWGFYVVGVVVVILAIAHRLAFPRIAQLAYVGVLLLAPFVVFEMANSPNAFTGIDVVALELASAAFLVFHAAFAGAAVRQPRPLVLFFSVVNVYAYSNALDLVLAGNAVLQAAADLVVAALLVGTARLLARDRIATAAFAHAALGALAIGVGAFASGRLDLSVGLSDDTGAALFKANAIGVAVGTTLTALVFDFGFRYDVRAARFWGLFFAVVYVLRSILVVAFFDGTGPFSVSLLASIAIVGALFAMGRSADAARPTPGHDRLAAAAFCAATALGLLAVSSEAQAIATALHRSAGMARTLTDAVWLATAAFVFQRGYARGDQLERGIGLGVLAATLAKVPFFDLSSFALSYRIAALMVLGAVALAVSAAYLRRRGPQPTSAPER